MTDRTNGDFFNNDRCVGQTEGQAWLNGESQSHAQSGGDSYLFDHARSVGQTGGWAALHGDARGYDQTGGGAVLYDSAQSHRLNGGWASLCGSAQSHDQTGGEAWLYDSAQSINLNGGTVYVRSPHAKIIDPVKGTVIYQELLDEEWVETRREVYRDGKLVGAEPVAEVPPPEPVAEDVGGLDPFDVLRAIVANGHGRAAYIDRDGREATVAALLTEHDRLRAERDDLQGRLNMALEELHAERDGGRKQWERAQLAQRSDEGLREAASQVLEQLERQRIRFRPADSKDRVLDSENRHLQAMLRTALAAHPSSEGKEVVLPMPKIPVRVGEHDDAYWLRVFAGQALGGLLAAYPDSDLGVDAFAPDAVNYARALLARLNEPREQRDGGAK